MAMEDWRHQPPYAPNSDATAQPSAEAKWQGSCFCGAVNFEAYEDPVDNKVCHCTQCQRLHGAPMQNAAIFHKAAVLFMPGSLQHLRFYAAGERKQQRVLPCKLSCSDCGSLIADEGRNMIMMFPMLFRFDRPGLPEAFQPSCHIFYGQRVVDVRDGKPKFAAHKDKSEKLPEVL